MPGSTPQDRTRGVGRRPIGRTMTRTDRRPRSSKTGTAESLVTDFGPRSPVARYGVRALAEALGNTVPRNTPAALEAGVARPQATPDRDSARLGTALESLAAAFGLSGHASRSPSLLPAVQTYYALVVESILGHCLGNTSAHWLVEGLDGRGDDPLAWRTRCRCPAIDEVRRRAAEVCARYEERASPLGSDGAGDWFKGLYEALFPRRLRHALGEYYTPDWLARHVLDQTGYQGDPKGRLLDPACGSGTFLVEAIRRLRAGWGRPNSPPEARPAELLGTICASIVGLDLNPLAVLTARANYLLAVRDLLPRSGGVEIPVYQADSILGRPDGLDARIGRFDYVVGNPPWIAWDDLAPVDREATKPLWQRYGLFTLSGRDARHGGAKKDLSVLMIYAAADRYLKDSGRLGMVVTQSVFQTRGAGDGFRRLRLGAEGPWLSVVRVDDLVACRPFDAAANWTATVVLEKGRPTVYPVPYVRWCADGRHQRPFEAAPIDPQRPTSPWLVWPQGWPRPDRDWIGPSDYEAHLGANTGGANGIYWVSLVDSVGANAAPGLVRVRNLAGRGKRTLADAEHLVEADLLYPLLRWADVGRYRAVPQARLLLVQDSQTRRGIEEQALRSRHPHAYAYFQQFRAVLLRRAAYRRYQAGAAFYSMYDVGPYTLAPIKVVWRRMDRRINAAVVGPVEDPRLGPRPAIPQETCVLVAADTADEAHYLCAVLNSSLVSFLVASHHVRGGKSFGSPGMLAHLRIRRYDPAQAAHRALANASRRAHELASSGEDGSEVQEQIDGLAGRLWGLADAQVGSLRSMDFI